MGRPMVLYLERVGDKLNPSAEELYRYLNFDKIAGFADEGRRVSSEEEAKIIANV
jgi:aconitate hydratase 2 / 2-methylisocitrate dehydratase